MIKKTTRLCGAIGLNISSQKYKAELGYGIGVSYWGQGYCTEAAKATVAYGFKDVNLYRIHSSHFRRNPASGRVMQKIGMIQEDCLRQDANKWGVFEDRILYGKRFIQIHFPIVNVIIFHLLPQTLYLLVNEDCLCLYRIYFGVTRT